MTPQFTDVQALYAWALKGNAEAVAFFDGMTKVAQVWDDLIDRDRQTTPAEINEAFWLALVLLPRNAFYRANFAELGPLVASAIVNWHGANALEQDGSDADLDIAFVARSEYVNLLLQAALLVGGMDWAIAVAPVVRRHCHSEGREAYRTHLAAQKAAAGA